jgi:hypothetical protein
MHSTNAVLPINTGKLLRTNIQRTNSMVLQQKKLIINYYRMHSTNPVLPINTG